MDFKILSEVAKTVGFDPSQGVIFHRSWRNFWEVQSRYEWMPGKYKIHEVDFLPWEGGPTRHLRETESGIYYVPELKDVVDPAEALKIIATHLGLKVT